MAQAAITLDNILSASWFFVPKWTPALKRNQSRDLLRLLVCKLYGSTKGQNLFHAKIRASHEALAADLGLSREWTCKLLARLREGGWLSYSTVRLPSGKFEVGTFSPGRMLKRLLCVLLGHRRQRKSRVNDASQSLPPSQEEREKGLLFLKGLLTKLQEKLSHPKRQ